MTRHALIAAFATLLAPGLAAAQVAQSDMLRQTVAGTTNPTASWQASFSPQMVSNLKTLAGAGAEAPEGCRPVMVTKEKTAPDVAGEALLPGMRCVKPLARANPQGGLEARALSTDPQKGADAAR